MSEIIEIIGGKVIGIKTSIFTIFNAEKYDAQAIPTAWQEFFAKAGGTELSNASNFYGVTIPSMSMDAPMDYYAGALVDHAVDVPGGMSAIDLPSGPYFSFTHHGPITAIAASYQKAYAEELPQSGKEMRPAPHLEIYNPQLNPMADDYEMAIAIPVL